MLETRDMAPEDLGAVLALNNSAVPAVNPHDAESLVQLIEMAERAWVADDGGVVAGLLVVFGPGASYESVNYKRLSVSYDDFAYVDRIVVAPTHYRRGLGGRLYGCLADHALASGRTRLLCEVNVEPPNPRSVAFHEVNGWRAIEDHEHGPGKTVRYFERLLP